MFSYNNEFVIFNSVIDAVVYSSYFIFCKHLLHYVPMIMNEALVTLQEPFCVHYNSAVLLMNFADICVTVMMISV